MENPSVLKLVYVHISCCRGGVPIKQQFIQVWIVFLISSVGGYFLYYQIPLSNQHPLYAITQTSELAYWFRYALILIVLPIYRFPQAKIAIKIIIACAFTLHAYTSTILIQTTSISEYSIQFVLFCMQSIVIWFCIQYQKIGWFFLYAAILIIDLMVQL